jgi:hypothetical protein
LYSPSVAVGRTPISIVKVSGWPSPGKIADVELGVADGMDAGRRRSPRGTSGPSRPRTVSSRTLSRPMRWITTGGGTLPLRKPGMRRF